MLLFRRLSRSIINSNYSEMLEKPICECNNYCNAAIVYGAELQRTVGREGGGKYRRYRGIKILSGIFFYAFNSRPPPSPPGTLLLW